jgi:hypothetical protein
MDNARGLTVMYDLNTFFDADDLNSFVERFDEEINDIVNDERSVTFPKVLMSQAEVKKLKKASPDIFNYIDTKLKETFGYSLEQGLLKDSGSYSKQSISKQAIAIDLSNNVNTLTIDLYKNVKPNIKTSDEVQVKRVTAGKLNSNQIKQLSRNMQTLEYFNEFKLVKGVVVNGSDTTLMEFPAVIKSVTGKTKKTVRYFKLKQVHSPFNLDQNKINVNEGISIGSAAVYELVETKGSNYQNPIGFMFDSSYFERPSYKQVREFVESNSAEGGFIEGAVNIEQNEKDILSKATVMGYDKVFIGNEIFIDLNTFKGQNSGENLVAISEVTEEMLEENDDYGSLVINQPAQQASEVKYYEGDITPEPNTVFVFGSNPLGINGNPEKYPNMSASVAVTQFGVKQGEKMINRLSDSGNAYGLVTVTGPGKKRSLTSKQIINNIQKLYTTAEENPSKNFKIAYRSGRNNNGYTNLELIEMFNQAGNIPSNVIFSKEWFDTGKLNIPLTEQAGAVDASNAPVVSALNLFANLEETNLEEEYPLLVDFWNNNIEANTEAMARLEEQNILTLEDFIAERNDPDMNYADDETFIDKINSCIL